MYHPDISIGKTTFVHKNAVIRSSPGTIVTIGDDCTIRDGAKIISNGGNIRIGNGVFVNHYSLLYGQGGLTIHDRVWIASHVTVIPANHIFDGVPVEVGIRGQTKEGIVIESAVWIGTGARILDGVTLRSGTVVGAGAVVTKSTEPGGIYVGVPAKLLRMRR